MTKKLDELELIDLMKDIPLNESIWIPDLIKNMKNTKRVYYILEKWSNKGYINYGTSLNGVWKELKFEELINETL